MNASLGQAQDERHLADQDAGPEADPQAGQKADLEVPPGQRRRWPALLVAGIGVAWVSMAAVAVVTMRPEVAAATRMAERAAIAVVPAVAAAPPPGLAAGPSAASSSASGASAAVPAGWRRHTDPQGFSVNLPDGWAEDYRSASQVRFTAPGQASGPGLLPGVAVVVAFTTTPKPDQYADWQAQAAWKAETDPRYQLIGTRRVAYRGYDCAEWEFLDSDGGQLTHYLDRGFISAPGAQAYAIELIAPAGQWTTARARLWAELLASFSPRLPG